MKGEEVENTGAMGREEDGLGAPPTTAPWAASGWRFKSYTRLGAWWPAMEDLATVVTMSCGVSMSLSPFNQRRKSDQ